MSDEFNWVDFEPAERTILVVHDESPSRELLVRWLTDDGWHCLSADDANQALSLLKTNSVQVVTCDINMPGENGMWLLEQAGKQFPDVSVLMLTTALETPLAIEALSRGASGYLLKPIQSREYLFQVRQAWERGRLLRERHEHLQTLERRVHEQTVALRVAQEETIHRLVMASAYRDDETGAHIRRTGLLSEFLALSAGWSMRDAEELRMAAPMHDVGKICISDAILRNRGKLTEDEFEQMKQHTTIGARMLADSSSPVLQMAEKIALSHHERWDGDGYPHRLAGENIPEAARILSIVDVYDAISHDRVYRAAMSEEMVLEIMRRGLGTHFDPHLLTQFLADYDQIREISLANPDEIACEDLDAELPLPPQGNAGLTEIYNS